MKRKYIKLSKIIRRSLSLILGLSMITVLLPLAAVHADALEDDDEDPETFLIAIGPLYPDGFRFEYTDGEAIDFTGLRLFGTYSDFSEKELTDFAFNPVQDTVLHCPADEVDGVIMLVDINYSEAGVDYGFDVQLTIYPQSTTDPDTPYIPGNTTPAADDGMMRMI